MRQYKRRKFFIDPQFQLKYILMIIFLLLLYTITFVGCLFIPQLLPFIFSSPIEEQAKAAEILLLYHKNVWPAVFIVIPLFGIFSIFITHKIAGPAYRIKKRLHELTAWELDKRVTLRKGDDLQELADCVNLLSEELTLFARELQQNYAALSLSIDEIRVKIKAGSINEETGQELIARLDFSRQNITETLERFNIDNR